MWDGATWCLEDLGSKNGTSLHGERIDRTPLRDGAWMSLGGLVAQFEPYPENQESHNAEVLASWRENSTGFLRDLDPAKGLEHLLGRLMDSLLRVSGADRGFVILVSPEGGLELAKVAHVRQADLEEGFSGSLGAVELALETARSVVISDAQTDAFLGMRPSVVEALIRNLVCLPLTVSGRVIGVVYADGRNAGTAFTELDVEMLEALVNQTALALWAAHLEEEIRRLAGHLSSRLKGGLDEGLEQELVSTTARMYLSYSPERGGAPKTGGRRLDQSWIEMVRNFRDRNPE